jgi:hypothetical protein
MGAKYDIGRGKPPKEFQYKKGQSGYPQGRPKGSTSIKAIVAKAMRRPIQIRMDGKVVKMSALEAAITAQVARAVKGDPKAFDAVMKYADKLQLLDATSSPQQDGGGKASGFAWTELHESLRPYLEHLGHDTKPITES